MGQLELIVLACLIAVLIVLAVQPIEGWIRAMRGAQWQRISQQFRASATILHMEYVAAAGRRQGDLATYSFSAEGWPSTDQHGDCSTLWYRLSGNQDAHWQASSIAPGVCLVRESGGLGDETRFLIYDSHHGRVEIHNGPNL